MMPSLQRKARNPLAEERNCLMPNSHTQSINQSKCAYWINKYTYKPHKNTTVKEKFEGRTGLVGQFLHTASPGQDTNERKDI